MDRSIVFWHRTPLTPCQWPVATTKNSANLPNRDFVMQNLDVRNPAIAAGHVRVPDDIRTSTVWDH